MKKRHPDPAANACPCGSGRGFDRCCGPYLNGEAAPSAETLMRSRFTAYVRENEAYLLATWAPETRPEGLALGDGPHLKWIGLTVHDAGEDEAGGAWVRFTATCKVGGRFSRIEERSRFRRADGRWLYVDGEVSQN